ncbi:PspC domain-containing protein [Corynebacterium pacaense]|uniref:ATP-binding protein n=1 Tax=Corynebacterium pacaense TaxID=1816684 RepID=UPI0009BC067E|nr:PspC domain-containing protein [Corynebacterium pacaense]
MSSTPAPYSPQPAGQLAAPYPRFLRARQGRVVAGVASGLAEHLGVSVFWVRAILIISALLNGVGLVAYALVWIFTALDSAPEGDAGSAPAEGASMGRVLSWVLVVVALLGAAFSLMLTTGFGLALIIPIVIVGVGILMVWLAYDRGLDSGANILIIVAGGVLVLAAIVVVVMNWDSQAGFGAALTTVVLTLLGVAALGVPLWLRLWDQLGEERAEKAAAAERAEIASRLHDSVLQTLALIQKRAADPAEVARLARGQERELRQWLFESQDKTPQTTGTVFTALERACAEVEDLFGLRIVPVTVGTDEPLTDATQAAVLAARECLVNVAKHAGVETADVYAEILAGELGIFVRDRGRGFDPDEVPEGRHGLAESVRGRVERAGGTVTVKSTPGEGTEVSITMAV